MYYLAIDLGASGGRHILGRRENGSIEHEEVHRFSNEPIYKNGSLVWDIDYLWNEIIAGLKKCAEIGKIPVSVGIDTWGVDFVLLDGELKMLGDAVAYRDKRTEGMDVFVERVLSEAELYSRTGIHKAIFNTIYQLMALKLNGGDILKKAEKLLMLPDYLHYRLSGALATEYTIAATTGLVSAETRDWDDYIINALEYPRHIFQKILPPGTVLGNLTPKVQEMVGFNCKVTLPAAHDTASAVIAAGGAGGLRRADSSALRRPCPTEGSENSIILSSGTWSLMGINLASPDCSEAARGGGFTNEGGADGAFFLHKMIMGLWMVQSIKKELNDSYSFAELEEMAAKAAIDSVVDVNSPRYLNPGSMISEVKADCAASNQSVPNTPGEITAVIYNSLAACYRDTALELEKLTGRIYDSILIMGGGSSARYLNALTARFSGKEVRLGPAEATAIGNIIAQM